MTSANSPPEDRSRQRRRITLRGTAFGDLAILMIGFGLLVGAGFPFGLIVIGVPAHIALRGNFFAATVAAGLIVGGVNFFLARSVVGYRVRELSERMGYVSKVITESTHSGDWSRCNPEDCELIVDSADALGEAASSFNGLLRALDCFRKAGQAMGDFSAVLVQHLEIPDLAEAALNGFSAHSGALAGAFAVLRDGEVVVEAAQGMRSTTISRSTGIRGALRYGCTTKLDFPEDLLVEAPIVTFRPRQVVVVPLSFNGEAVGVVVLAFTEAVPAEVLKLVDHLGQACGVALNNALAHERLRQLTGIDPLTGAYNRRFGDGRLREEWARSARNGTPLGLISFDLDHFKAVNDTHGHLAGDRVLKEAVDAARLAIREGDVLVRVGGEEFLVLLPGARATEVEIVAERVRHLVSAHPVSIGETCACVTVSLAGLSWPGVDVNGPEEMLAKLDEALYQSKRRSRNVLTMVAPGRAAVTRAATGAHLKIAEPVR